MNNNVVIDIGGRPALPLRALPYVTAWAEAPDSIVRALGLAPTVRVGGIIQERAERRVEIPNKQALSAYRMNADGTWTAVPHRQWHAVGVELSSLTTKLQADERHGADGENHAGWRVAAVRALPNDVFVWLDEFERWFGHTRPLAIPSDDDVDLWRIEQAKLYDAEDLVMVLEEGMADFERPGQLDVTVVLPAELDGHIWRYSTAAPESDNGKNEMPKSRGGRPSTLHEKVTVIAALMAEFEKAGASLADPLQLPGTAADLHDALKRIEKSVTQKNAVFQVTQDTFHGWLSSAGFGFGAGRPRDNEARYWTKLVPRIAGKIPCEVFPAI